MKVREYTNLVDTLLDLQHQVRESYSYAVEFIPNWVNTPTELFYFLKANITYKDDPRGAELLQKMQTLFENNYHGISGAGDCDCFVITALACFYVLGIKKPYIILAGNGKQASHIYAGYESGNTIIPFDLTNPLAGTERYYKKVQRLKFYY